MRIRLDEAETRPVIVRATTNTRHPDWGDRVVPDLDYQALEDNLRSIDEWRDACGYRMVWSNADFEIHIHDTAGQE
jgi:hypothetical protein